MHFRGSSSYQIICLTAPDVSATKGANIFTFELRITTFEHSQLRIPDEMITEIIAETGSSPQ